MRGNFNAFGSPSMSPKLPVAYANRGVDLFFDLNFGKPTRWPLRVPLRLLEVRQALREGFDAVTVGFLGIVRPPDDTVIIDG